MDFFTLPTVNFHVLYVIIMLSHNRRKVVHFNITEHPTARWTAQQLVEAFPFDSAPQYLLRDRDAIYSEKVQRRIRSLGIEEVVTAPRSPWQNPYCERVIGTCRRDCLEHIIVLSEHICTESSGSTSATIMLAERIYRCAKIRLNLELLKPRELAM